jgi:hypothetical protein
MICSRAITWSDMIAIMVVSEIWLLALVAESDNPYAWAR